MALFKNPVIRGFNPDPSICRVGDDFYLVTSSFEYFPGVPIYHSRNLVNWELIGHCLTEPEQLDLTGCPVSGGIYAPTLRYHKGIFYMTTTNTSGGGNFVVHTSDIRGTWSKPAWVAQGGIDPSLLFEDDDQCYFQSTTRIGGVRGIYQCRIDPFTGRMLTSPRLLTSGTGGREAEAPHVYRIGNHYYLMMAEGGTEYGHMVTIFRSSSIDGPYEPCPHNPVLTHRDLNRDASPIQCTGHADIVEDQNGNWWMVALGVRQLPYNMLHNLGRETFLARVEWNADGWPVVNKGKGIRTEIDAPLPEPPNETGSGFHADFTQGELSKEFCYLRNPHENNYRLCSEKGQLQLTGEGIPLSCGGKSPTFVSVRQKEFNVFVKAGIKMSDHSKAGITAFSNENHHYDIYMISNEQGSRVCLNKRLYDLEVETASIAIAGNEAELVIKADENHYHFYLIEPITKEHILLGSGEVAGLCSEVTRFTTFTGVFLGMFCEYGSGCFDHFSVTWE